MRTFSLLGLLPALLLAGCHDVPSVDDPHRVVVDGHPMTQLAFLDQYCQGQQVHPTCNAVSQAMVRDATRGAMPKGW